MNSSNGTVVPLQSCSFRLGDVGMPEWRPELLTIKMSAALVSLTCATFLNILVIVAVKTTPSLRKIQHATCLLSWNRPNDSVVGATCFHCQSNLSSNNYKPQRGVDVLRPSIYHTRYFCHSIYTPFDVNKCRAIFRHKKSLSIPQCYNQTSNYRCRSGGVVPSGFSFFFLNRGEF